MRKIISLSILFVVLLACGSPLKKKELKTPEESFPGLFQEVQMAAIFSDSKTFADCIPKTSSEEIMAAYEAAQKEKDFDLKTFVDRFFDKPLTVKTDFVTDTSLSASAHIENLWSYLKREPKDDGGTLIPLRKPYIVPGGRFREIYYWDSYFTMLGMAVDHKDTLIEDMVVNFGQLIQDFGHIPNGNRTYYLSRSQPPFFSLMVELLAEVKKDEQVYVNFLPQLTKEYQYWMSSTSKEEAEELNKARKSGEKSFKKVYFVGQNNMLNRYKDESNIPRAEAYKEDVATASTTKDKSIVYNHLRSGAESGWDFSSRWLADGYNLNTIHTTDILPVDLNALLYHLEEVLEKANTIAGKKDYAESYRALKNKRKAIFDQYFWDENSGFYRDYDLANQKQTSFLSLAAVYPLFVGLASETQAQKVAAKLASDFLKPGGLTSTLVNTGQQWDAPNGWSPLQWMAIQGLRNYKEDALANEIKKRWVNNVTRVYKNTGKMMEKYNVYDLSLDAGGGEYPVQDGFGWTNGVLQRLLKE